ncbi:MAG: phage tail length tape measure family protein, partial [Rubrivivax sp.]|nr:phage tail length tape measure family protein [Rubrivivax sp.]
MANKGNTIEAKLRIAAEVAEAITALQKVRKELADTSKAASTAGKGNSGKGAGAAAAAETDQVVAQVKKRTQAESQAAAAKKQQDKEEATRQRELVKERKRVADEEERARKKKQTADDRQRQLDEAARRRTERQAVYNKAALAPQVNDIFVGLTTGQSPLQVALQQGPQITQIYGGVANTFRAITAALTPMRVGLGLAAVGFATLAANIAAGYRESSQLNKELALSGNIANASQGQINGLATDISAATGQSIGFVRDALREVLTLSGQTDTTIGSTARAAAALAKLNGQSAEEAVKGFENQADGITQWSVKANRAYNFLTAGQVAYVRALEQQGRIAEATRFVNDQLADTLQQRGVGAIGLIERGWNAAGRAVSFFLDQLKKVGRDETTEERLASLAQQLKTVEGRIDLRARGLLRDGRRGEADTAERDRLLGEIQATNREAVRRSEDAAALREEQERIKREAKEFQQILASQRAAGAQRTLAQREAELDAEKALVDRAHAQELLSASDQAL